MAGGYEKRVLWLIQINCTREWFSTKREAMAYYEKLKEHHMVVSLPARVDVPIEQDGLAKFLNELEAFPNDRRVYPCYGEQQ